MANFPRSGRADANGNSAKNPPACSVIVLSRNGMAKAITIVGGGLAGLTLGIGLRQRDVPVTVVEAGTYPRHRVCGEFISGRGQDSLQRLGLLAKLQSAKTCCF